MKGRDLEKYQTKDFNERQKYRSHTMKEQDPDPTNPTKVLKNIQNDDQGVKFCVEMAAVRSQVGSIRSPCWSIWIKSDQCGYNLNSKVGASVMSRKAVKLRSVVIP